MHMSISKNFKKLILSSLILILLAIIALLYNSRVDNAFTNEDKAYINYYLSGIKDLPENPSYEEEINLILNIQAKVLEIAPTNKGIPHGSNRGLKDLYETRYGLCYDRSRILEIIYRYKGFETRHISIYSTLNTGSPVKSILTPNTPSHAVTEILTSRGWLLVDSNSPWIAIDSHRQPMSIENIHQAIEGATLRNYLEKPPIEIYIEPFTYVYGLYSRHGKFFQPYNFIPDINYQEFMANF